MPSRGPRIPGQAQPHGPSPISQGQYAKRSVPGRWSVYKGEFRVGGSRLMGYIARPSRVRAPVTDAGSEKTTFVNAKGKAKTVSRVVNLGRPRILLVSIPKAEYRPVMQGSFEDAVAAARRNVAELMASEHANTIAHAVYKSGQGRLNAILSQMEGASRRGEYDREGPGLTRGRALRAEANCLLDVLGRGR